MAELTATQPGWISPPGAIVARILEKISLELDDFAFEVGLSSRAAKGLIEGTIAIDENIACRLASIVGSTPSFWLRCEQSYREDIERNMSAYVDDEVKAWLKQLPIREMAEFGWIERRDDPVHQAEECFRFFGVVGLEEWKLKHRKLLTGTNFRTSEAFNSQPTATSAWLRWAENKAEEVSCASWNPSAFSQVLSEIRLLSRNHHPERFVPKLRALCADVGIAVIVAPAPAGCRASGAAKLIRGRKAMIVFSFRYYSDDQFWFTFFHEAGHLLKHSEHELFLEEENGPVDEMEMEANQFALDTLIPLERQNTMLALPQEYNAYLSFAREIGIAPGIVVGQMQRLGYLPYSWLRKLKRRFEWNDLYESGIIP